MKITNSNLQASLSKMMGQGSPLNAIIQEQKPKKTRATKNKPKQPKQAKPSTQSEPRLREKNWRDKAYEVISEQVIFIFNDRPYEAMYRHQTLTLLDLTTFQSSITHTLWEDEQIQQLHYYLQVNWEQLEIHDTEEVSDTTLLIDEFYNIRPLN